MTAKDRARIARLERETIHLREKLEKHMAIYREQLFEIVDLRTRLDLVRETISTSNDDGVTK